MLLLRVVEPVTTTKMVQVENEWFIMTYIFFSTILNVSSPTEPIANGYFHIVERVCFLEFIEHENIFTLFHSVFPNTIVNTLNLESEEFCVYI